MRSLFENALKLLLSGRSDLTVDDLILAITVLFLVWLLVLHLFVLLYLRLLAAGFQWRARKNFVRLAGQLDLQVRREPRGRRMFAPGAFLAGERQGRHVRLYSCHYRIAAAIALAASYESTREFRLSLRPNYGFFLNFIVYRFILSTADFKDFRLQKASSGDQAFDQAYLLKSSNPDSVADLLTAEIRSELLTQRRQPRGEAPSITIGGGEAIYLVYGQGGTAFVSRLAEKIPLVCELAAHVEDVLTNKFAATY